MNGASRLLSWAAKNERKLGAGLFAFGFLIDFFTFGVLPVELVSIGFLAYLALAAVCTLGAHAFSHPGEKAAWWRRALSVIFPLGVQYAFGGLLSGFVVFYTAHSVVLASWPFLLVLALVYIGNEYFRMYKHYLAFQTVLFFFTLYAYSIFALPLYLGAIGPFVFLASTAVALGAFALFLLLLERINKARVAEAIGTTRWAAAGIVAVVSAAYFSGAIPPIPLALQDAGIYHSLAREPGAYVVQGEQPREWWDIRTPLVHARTGETLYAFTAVAAPTRFTSAVVHRWEKLVPDDGWRTVSRVSFPMVGGRDGGYRGYSEKTGVTEGAWRLSVETTNGQVIGRLRFDVKNALPPEPLVEERL